ncbi:acyl carrier protein [Stigmatella aurantiaca]|jgi:acyl carrier protein|uniref:Acyl carrier protein n=1 Tax=Stigmatella aurantiaca TaxID=41 RepID=A0A1H8F805_STIAU|nr:acyl carrier protein [Stigmatella aurantiaca]SEN27524.1 acyl carrier protein [Stigmatella aurantiaca]
MTRDEIRSKVMQIAGEVFELEPEELQGDKHIIDELGATSVMRLEFIVMLERGFGLQFVPEEIEVAQNLDEVVGVVETFVRRKAS